MNPVYLLRRVAILAGSLVVASLLVFAVTSVLPGDPARVILGERATEENLEQLRSELGLDRPLWAQYTGWVTGMATGDFGTSHISRAPVGPMIAQRLQVTIPLAGIGMLLALAVAAPLGVYAASRHGRAADPIISALSQVGIAIPAFWTGILLVTFLAVRLGWFPAGGFVPVSEDPVGWIRSITLPAVSLALVQGAILTRYIRSAVLEVMREDFIRTAQAKGLTRARALRRHGLRNAAIPVVTLLGLQFAFLFAGTVVIENVFVLPGLGRMILQAVNGRDLVLVQATVMVLTSAILIVNFLVDLTYRLIDPRLRAAA